MMKSILTIVVLSLLTTSCSKEKDDHGLGAVFTNSGTISITNNTADPYAIYVDSVLHDTLSAKQNEVLTLSIASHTLNSVQLSGFSSKPTAYSKTVTIYNGSKLDFIFP